MTNTPTLRTDDKSRDLREFSEKFRIFESALKTRSLLISSGFATDHDTSKIDEILDRLEASLLSQRNDAVNESLPGTKFSEHDRSSTILTTQAATLASSKSGNQL
ncbi:MAG: hypothetical protein AAFR13_02825 [Pseudomonadota bacterium]